MSGPKTRTSPGAIGPRRDQHRPVGEQLAGALLSPRAAAAARIAGYGYTDRYGAIALVICPA
ncbi:hypothetical protein [Nocardia sp. NPDC003963]